MKRAKSYRLQAACLALLCLACVAVITSGLLNSRARWEAKTAWQEAGWIIPHVSGYLADDCQENPYTDSAALHWEHGRTSARGGNVDAVADQPKDAQ